MTHDERMRIFGEAGLYLVTSQALSAGRTTGEIIRAALEAGVRLFQLREKDVPISRFLKMAEEARELTAARGALLIINDRLDIAMAAGADGVHLGQDDLPIRAARRLAPDMIIGASTHSVTEALAAQTEGASYVNVGPIFPTGTKPGATLFLGIEGLKRIVPVIRVPFTVMGGIKREHVKDLVAAGARTLAVVTAVTMAPDPGLAARGLLEDIRAARDRADALRKL